MGIGNISADLSAKSGSSGTASVGDNSYIVDSSTSLDFGGANVDSSTNISMGLQGNEVQSLNNMFQNAIGAVAEVANQSARVANNVANKESGIVSFAKENATYLIVGAIALIALFNIDKIRKAIK